MTHILLSINNTDVFAGRVILVVAVALAVFYFFLMPSGKNKKSQGKPGTAKRKIG
jgi:hypothetical protein